MKGTGIYAVAGIRVRAIRCESYAIGDGSTANAFVDISIRIRGGRPAELKERTVGAVFDAARAFLAPQLETIPMALSLELRDIDPAYSPKINSMNRQE